MINNRSLFFSVLVSLVIGAAAVGAKTDNGSVSSTSAANLNTDQAATSAKGQDKLRKFGEKLGLITADEPTMQEFLADRFSDEQLNRRPLLKWRRFANQPLHVVPATLFLFSVVLILGEIFQSNLEVARECCRAKYWRSFGSGMLASVLALAFVRPLMLSDIGSFLATVIIAFVELLQLCGFAVSATLIAQTLLTRMHIAEHLNARPRTYRFIVAFVGTIALSSTLLIPAIGPVPPIGIRFISLFCLLGAGALLKTGWGTRIHKS